MMADELRAEDCPFCKIATGVAAAKKVFESEEVLAFLPVHPAVVGHTLVIPKRHIRDLWHLDAETSATIMEAVLVVAKGIKIALAPEGINLINSSGEAASQTVFHLHMHLVPRWAGDRMGAIWPPDQSWPEGQREALAKRIHEGVNSVT
ncbi:HIT family protein [Streptomyces roseochromogenus]|uniref:HIT family protein n=1 Tax=Streptomyces roseochromogenus TaxID=285450 RepID=UPI0009961C29|nr:HIT family protein [Streptomyces roseochromogenus]